MWILLRSCEGGVWGVGRGVWGRPALPGGSGRGERVRRRVSTVRHMFSAASHLGGLRRLGADV